VIFIVGVSDLSYLQHSDMVGSGIRKGVHYTLCYVRPHWRTLHPGLC